MFRGRPVFIVNIRYTFIKGGLPFSAVTFEGSFLSVIILLPVSVIYHIKVYVVNLKKFTHYFDMVAMATLLAL